MLLRQVDIFKERILVSSVRAQFPDYQGALATLFLHAECSCSYAGDDSDYNAARDYFKGRFTRLNRSQSKEICEHRLSSSRHLLNRYLADTNYTTAIDTNLMRVVMASVTDIIVTRSLNEISEWHRTRVSDAR